MKVKQFLSACIKSHKVRKQKRKERQVDEQMKEVDYVMRIYHKLSACEPDVLAHAIDIAKMSIARKSATPVFLKQMGAVAFAALITLAGSFLENIKDIYDIVNAFLSYLSS